MLNYFAKIIVFILFFIVIFSCNAVKRVSEGEYLLEKNKIIVNDKKTSAPEVTSFLRQKPNQKVLGLPVLLNLYNLGNPNYKTKFEDWLENNPEKDEKLTKLFSEKQVKALGKSYRGINGWFIRNGEPPVISDSAQIKKTVNSLYKYYISKGYYDANVTFKEHKKDNKRAIVDYLITTNNPYFIDSISTSIQSPVLDSIYHLHKDKSFVVQGKQIDFKNLENEENRLVKLFRNSGIYSFNKNIAGFWIDTINTSNNNINVSLKIAERIIERNDSLHSSSYKVQSVKNVNVFTDFSFNNKNDKIQDSAFYNGINFYAIDKLKYNPKYLANSIIIQPEGIYRDTERDLTRKYLRELQNFRPSINIKYQENEDKSLTANIYLTPLKKYSLGFDTEVTTSNIKPLGILGKFSLFNRNVFKGAEILELSFQGSINTSKDGSDNSKFFNAWELGTSATLRIPRILFPINTTKVIPKRMTPKTNIGVSINLQRNIGLDRKNITGGIDYTWQSSKTTNHKFELLNVQYINNENVENYFNIFNSEYNKLNVISKIIPPENLNSIDIDGNLITSFSLEYIKYVLEPSNNFETTNNDEFLEAQKVNERREILIEDVLVPVISYTFNYNNRENFNDNSFSAFTGRLISSGSVTSAFVKKPTDDSKKQVFGLQVAQYLKTEIEYKKYWGINSNTSLVFRNFIGVAIPFGNSDDIPFSRSYRAGGSNDIRAWKTFKLGPGSKNSTLEFNTGSLKLTTNLEYRYKVLNNIHSAFFIDAGNIWDITNSAVTESESKFNGFSSLKDIAVGSGFGMRYDFSFLIFRFDIGFKTYEPYLSSQNKWFKNYNFNRAVYNIGINYPF